MISFQQTLQDVFGMTQAFQGSIREDLFAPLYTIHPEAFPFQTSTGAQSLRQTLESWNSWPKQQDFTTHPQHPHDAETSYSQSIQGISHTQNYWVFSQQARRLVFWPVIRDLESANGISFHISPTNAQLPADTPFQPGYHHYGDCSARYYPVSDQWLIIVAVEGRGVDNVFALHAFHDPGLGASSTQRAEYLGYWRINDGPQETQATDAPWVAIHPTLDLVYSSTFGPVAPGKGTGEIQLYSFSSVNDSSSGLTFNTGSRAFKRLARLVLRDKMTGDEAFLNRVKGGTVSPQGRLFITSDRPAQNGGGVWGVDLVTGRLMVHLPSWGGDSIRSEIEGVTIWKYKPFSAPHVSGHIHLTVLDNELLHDDITIRHWGASNSAALDHL